jgi:uncharacterized protein (UPF0335 family)
VGTPGIGHNSEGACDAPIIDETRLANVLRVAQAQYNRASADKRNAAEVIRDETRAFRDKNAEVYSEITAIMESARDRLKDKLRALPNYAQAEAEKRAASAKMREALKTLKAHGVDTRAFKLALRMGEMDKIEREELFDSIDIYCKALRLW